MFNMDGTLKKISPLLKRALFSASDARALGVHPAALSYYCKTGALLRISHGFYRNPKRELDVPFEWEDLALTVSTIKDGVICLETALILHGLSNHIAREFFIAVPKGTFPPRRQAVRIVHRSDMELGKTLISLGEFKLPIFEKERCVVEAFKYLDLESALFALKKYLESEKRDLKKLELYARKLSVDMGHTVEAMLL